MTIIAIVGPTASGKTAAALSMAHKWEADIVGADASQVYVGMDIGTGKATESELAGVCHHMLDIVQPDEHFDAARYAELARQAIEECQAKGRRVILCGGTGLYLRALIEGLCAAPPVGPEVKADLKNRIQQDGVRALHDELKRVDPGSAQRIAAQDTQRVERALGVFLTTGRPLSGWQTQGNSKQAPLDVKWLGIRWPRAALCDRIEGRVQQMIANGWLEEVQGLMERGFGPNLKSMGALGYRFLGEHIEGERSLTEAIDKTVIATRRYAKRQMTWFRANREIAWYDAPLEAQVMDRAFDEIWGAPPRKE